MINIEEIKSAIEAAKKSYQYVALRTVDADWDPTEASVVWVDGERTNKIINGVCATCVDEPTAFAQHSLANRNYRVGYYPGDVVYVIAGHSAQRGNDIGELIIKDATVIGKWEH